VAFGDFNDLYTEAARRARRDITLAADLTEAKNAVNEAYIEVCDDGTFWDFLEVTGTFNTAAATPTYTYTTIGTALSVTVSDVLALRQTTGPTMYPLDWSDFERMRGLNTTLSAASEIWSKQSDSQVVLYPTPSGIAAITALVRKEPVLLSGDTDVPFIPLAWRRRVLVPYAAWKLMQQESGEAAAEAQSAWSEWERAMLAFKAAHGRGEEAYPTETNVLLPTGLRGTAGTFLYYAQQACYRAGRKPWVDFDITRAKELINEAQIAACDSSDDWDFVEKEGQITISAGDVYTYSGITTALGLTGQSVSEVLSLVHDNVTIGGGLLEPMPWESLEAISSSTQDGDGTGMPLYWTAWGDDRVRVWPSPDIPYKLGLKYRVLPSRMTADTDVALIPAGWAERIMVCYAASHLARDRGDHATADREYAAYQDALVKFQRAHGAARKPTQRLMSPTWASDLDDDSHGWWS
jgi:hypothetical protein